MNFRIGGERVPREFIYALGVDELTREALPTDAEVLQRALGLRTPVAITGDLDLAHGVFFDTVGEALIGGISHGGSFQLRGSKVCSGPKA